MEAAFREVDGVVNVTAGYSGGHTEHPTYGQVCTGGTGHAESVLVEYDPAVVSYEQLLDVFWSIHDPTTKDRQGPDAGNQYRSAIFYFSVEQGERAVKSKERLENSGRLRGRAVVTEIRPASAFYPAEEYHQRYHEKHGLKSCGIR